VLAIKRKSQWVQLTSEVYLRFIFYSSVGLQARISFNSKRSKRSTGIKNFLETVIPASLLVQVLLQNQTAVLLKILLFESFSC